MSAQVVDEELGLGVGDAAEQRKPVITVSTKNHSPRDANEAENTLQNDTTSSGGNEHVETHRESGAVRSNAVSTGNAGGPSGTNAGSQNNHRKFEPIPPCSWECARTRPQKEFIGHTQLEEWFIIPRLWPAWATLNIRYIETDTDNLRRRVVCRETPIIANPAQRPPRSAHVVLGIFNESGRLLDEVIVYIGGTAGAMHLIHGRRGLFRLPILRDIGRFGLYKCDQAARAHVRVELISEDEDALAALFKCVQRWEYYYTLKDASKYWTSIFRTTRTWADVWLQFFIDLYFLLLHKYKLVQAPDPSEEREWCEWIQKNISGGDEDPAKGQYSIECVLGWSRPRIIGFVIVPFVLAAVGTTTFGFVWSFNIGSHTGDAAGGFTIASYFAVLAGAVVALIGFFGSLSYK